MKNKALLIIFLLALISSILLLFTHSGDTTFCKPDEGCGSVQQSKYGYLFNISNSVYGVAIFAFLSIITISQIIKPKKNKQLLIDAGAIAGFLIAMYFIYLQAFVLQEFCRYCMIIDIGMIIAFLIVVPKDLFRKKII